MNSKLIKNLIVGLSALLVAFLLTVTADAAPPPNWARTMQVMKSKPVPPPVVLAEYTVYAKALPPEPVPFVTVTTTPSGNLAISGLTLDEIERNLQTQQMGLQISILVAPTDTEYYRTTTAKIALLDQIIWMLQHRAPDPT